MDLETWKEELAKIMKEKYLLDPIDYDLCEYGRAGISHQDMALTPQEEAERLASKYGLSTFKDLHELFVPSGE